MADVRPIDANKFEEYLKKAFGKFDLCFLLVGAIRSEPTLDYAPVRHGEWKKRKNWFKYVCSECSHEYEAVSHYCPNCGAKMDGGKTDA